MNIRTENCEIWIAKGIFYISIFSLIHIHIDNPFATWWKARKYFKRPSLKFHFGLLKYSFPYAHRRYIGKIIDISIQDVCWKDKYNSPRHERNPYLWICLFRLIRFEIGTYIPELTETGKYEDGSMYYWEYMLDYLYYSKTLEIQYCWETSSKIYKYTKYFGSREDGEEDQLVPYKMVIQTPLFSLNKRGLKEFSKIYETRT